jgi:chromosome segregation ATPase
MKKIEVTLFSLIVNGCFVLLIGFATSCTNRSQNESYQVTIDSLIAQNNKQSSHIQEIEGFITSLSQTMDSINIQEMYLIYEGDIEKRKPVSRSSLIKNLKLYKDIIDRQKEQIGKLERQLASKGDEMSIKMSQIVAFYKKQLEEKDRMIASLQMNISEHKTSIRNLQASVSSLLATTSEQEQKIIEQEATMSRQTDMINTCYVRIVQKRNLRPKDYCPVGF